MLEQQIDFLEELLQPWQETIGADYPAYRNHVYRMLHFCFYLGKPNAEARTKLIIAAVFHDIGIWTAHSVDYLPPSVTAAQQYLESNDLNDWREEISLMIDLHHKVRAVKDNDSPLIEIFRQGDLVDFSLGLIKHGVPKTYIDEVKAAFPNAGFHKRLMQLSWGRLKSHPFSPAPMLKW